MTKTAVRVSLCHPEIQTLVRDCLARKQHHLHPAFQMSSLVWPLMKARPLASRPTQPLGNVSEQNVIPCIAHIPTTRLVPLESTQMQGMPEHTGES